MSAGGPVNAVLIATWSGGVEPLRALLSSLTGLMWPLYIVVNDAKRADRAWLTSLPGTVIENENDGYELGAFRLFLERTAFDAFVFLQDSFVVRDLGLFERCFAQSGSIAFGPQFHHYAGKWRREPLERLGIPGVADKEESIRQETAFTSRYRAIEPTTILDPAFDDQHAARVEHRYGRDNLVLENEWLVKYKGTWR